MDRGLLVVIAICVLILLLTYFDRRAGGRWGVLQTVIVLAFLFFGMYAAQIVDPGNKDTSHGFSFFFGAIGMGCAFLITWLLARLIDASRERRRIRREHL